jgi:hypothetical protein
MNANALARLYGFNRAARQSIPGYGDGGGQA